MKFSGVAGIGNENQGARPGNRADGSDEEVQSDDYLRAVCLVRAIADDCDDEGDEVVVENRDCWLVEMAIVDGCKWKGWKWAVGGYL